MRSSPARVARTACGAIERIEATAPAWRLRQFLVANRPVVINAPVSAWHLRWTPEALRERFGGCEIEVEQTHQVYVGERPRRHHPLGPIVEGMLSGDTSLRWKGLEFLRRVPAMRADLEARPPPSRALLPAGAHGLRDTLWLAPSGTMSSLHHDGNFDNLNLQISGRKLFRLLPPPSHREVYAYGSAESPLNPFAPDLARFPRFARATAVEATLSPGDTLLLPRYWWHCVYAFEPSVNLSTHFGWAGEPSAWTTLRGAPLARRSLTWIAAGLKRHRLHRLANASRRAWSFAYQHTVPRVAPQPRCQLTDAPAS